jgi:hypothetical protein
MKTLLTLFISALLITPAMAENVLETDQYTIHYNAFNSTVIDADAAKKNGLIRSKYSAMINLAVLKKQADGSTIAVRSFNKGSVENLLRQQQSLSFVTIDEGKAIYYIASFRFADQEQMNFAITLQPDPNKAPIKLTLSQKFYVD